MYRIVNKISNKNNIRLYHKNIINHFENPKNVGTFNKNFKNVGIGLVGAPACGDVMKLSIKVKDNIIIDSKFKTFGCGSAIASSSYITEYIKGLHIDKAYTIENKQISDELKLPPVKLHCSMLAKDAIQSAIEDYITKNNRANLDF
tara:strand:- start:53 stop:490 length:438 start_codon:yes stop_codon:yes gene_type:complete